MNKSVRMISQEVLEILRNKQLSFILVLLVLMVFSTASISYASTPTVLLDGSQIPFDVSPTIENSRTLVPLRAIFEALGTDISWDESTRTITAIKTGIEVKLQIGSQTAYKNGSPVILDVPAKIINERTLVPLRFVSEALGAKVGWHGRTQTINITSDKELKEIFKDVNAALMWSAFEGHIDTLQEFLSKGADVNARDSNSKTVLMMASEEGHTDIVKILLAKGADVNAKMNDDVTALIWAASEGHSDIVNTLLANGADVNAKKNDNTTALMYAASKGYIDIVKTLLVNGAYVYPDKYDGNTDLMIAAGVAQSDIVQALLESGTANVNAKNNDGATALMCASMSGDSDIVYALLANGADMNAKANNGATALMIAAIEGNTDVVKVLLSYGVDVNAKADNGKTALIVATENGRSDIAQLLSGAGAQAAQQNVQPKTTQPAKPQNNNFMKNQINQMLIDQIWKMDYTIH